MASMVEKIYLMCWRELRSCGRIFEWSEVIL